VIDRSDIVTETTSHSTKIHTGDQGIGVGSTSRNARSSSGFTRIVDPNAFHSVSSVPDTIRDDRVSVGGGPAGVPGCRLHRVAILRSANRVAQPKA